MKYLVMECEASYAVVLDNDGRFHKVPNLGYEVGQHLDHVVIFDPIKTASSKIVKPKRWLINYLSTAACIMFLLFGACLWQMPVGTVQMEINPHVKLSVNCLNRVVGLSGLNADGEKLIENYSSYGQKLETVSNELADRAAHMKYLKEDGQILLTVDSSQEKWKTNIEQFLQEELQSHVGKNITVVVATKKKVQKKTSPVPSKAPTITVKATLTPSPSKPPVTKKPTPSPRPVSTDDDDDDDDRYEADDDHDDRYEVNDDDHDEADDDDKPSNNTNNSNNNNNNNNNNNTTPPPQEIPSVEEEDYEEDYSEDYDDYEADSSEDYDDYEADSSEDYEDYEIEDSEDYDDYDDDSSESDDD